MLKPALHIIPPEWMNAPQCVAVMRALGGFETPAQAMFVGGCVRNTLMNLSIKDIDIATIHTPEIVMEKLKTAGIRYVPTGLDHGTIMAVMEGHNFEITTLRRDVKTDGRHAIVAFTDEWGADAARRDFTMNALYASINGDVYDFTGHGLRDIEHHKVIFVGDASSRIQEDYLRILRYFRFHAEYGRGEMETAALNACQKFASKISTLSKERITQEFLKIIGAQNPAPILKTMFSCGVLKSLGKKFDAEIFGYFCDLQQKQDAMNVMARLFIVGTDEMIILSNAQKKELAGCDSALKILGNINAKSIRRAVYETGNAAAVQGYLLKTAQSGQVPDLDLLDIAKSWAAPIFPIKAADLMNEGMVEGPALGARLKELEAAWVERDFV